MQIDTDMDDVNQHQYNVRTGYLYEFNKSGFLTYLNGLSVPFSCDEFNEILTENLIETNFSHQLPYATLNELASSRVFSEDLIEIFGLLKEDDISIFNNSSNEVNVRIRSRTLGSPNFFSIKPYAKRVWRRVTCTENNKKNNYLIEFVTENNFSYRYNINVGNNYEFKDERNLYLIDAENPENKSLINRTFDLFNSVTSITRFDIKAGELKQYDIIYENNKVHLNKSIPSRIPYFDNQSPGEYFENFEEKNQGNSLSLSSTLNSQCQNNNKFIDKFFPPEKWQILGIDENGQEKKPHFRHLAKRDEFKFEQGKGKNLIFEYKRPSEIFRGKNFKLFLDEINCDDANQGLLGNCYLISIIAALSQRIDLINKIFKTKKINEFGFYELFYYDEEGTKKIIFVDDYFPYVNMDGKGLKLLGTIPNGEEIWVMLMEKAYAKYEGGWANIEGGTITSELKFFTGCNCKNIELSDNHAWLEILNACKRENIVCCRSKNGGNYNHNFTSKNNIANSHAYSILNAGEYKGLRLLKVRNPWGEIEWKGDYSDDCELWTDELKDYFEFHEGVKEDGIFWMKFEDFVNEFFDLVICYC